MTHRFAKETSPIITLHILYDSLGRRLFEGRHIFRKGEGKGKGKGHPITGHESPERK